MTLTPEQAGLGIICCVVASDGRISEAESELISLVTHRHVYFRHLATAAVKGIIQESLNRIVESSATSWATSCAAAVPSDQRATLFALAADFAFSDGRPGDAEIGILQAIQKTFQIPAESAATVFNVIAQKNGIPS